MIKTFLTALALCLFSSLSRADEGMWLYTMLDKLQLNQKGCKLSADQIYSINHSSLKDAILGLGSPDRPTSFFCTAELVGSRGLVFTNHHCGYECIAQHSTVLHNYLHDGFWAATDADELPNSDLTAARLVYMIDITDSIVPHLSDTLSAQRRTAIIDSLSNIQEKRVSDTSKYVPEVESLFADNQYFLFVYEVFSDVRLVGTPPESIGKFGGDTDNWMWPRHTGDFAVFRLYTNKANKPATYDSTNVPFQTTQNLKISLAGYSPNSYAMIMGFPGSTERYQPAIAIQHKLETLNPLRIDIRTQKLAVYKKFMDADTAIYLKYATKWAQTSNYWKNFIGENESIKRLEVLKQKQTIERDLQQWIDADSLRHRRYGALIATLNAQHERRLALAKLSTSVNEAFFSTSHYFSFGYELNALEKELWAKKDSSIQEEISDIKQMLNETFSQVDVRVEEEILALMFQMFFEKNPNQLLDLQKTIKTKYKNNYALFANAMVSKSILSSEKKMAAFLAHPTGAKLRDDIGYSTMLEVLTALRTARKTNKQLQDSILWQEHLYVAALLEKNAGSPLYPDANSTPRLTYGKVAGYQPFDATHYNYFTTLQGVMQKEIKYNTAEFAVPQQLKTLFETRNYGRYATNDSLPVCFLTSNDITGGNSGSPVMDANGNLIGIAFDGNWESLSGDIIFAKTTQRSVNVDIRYVLFIIDKFANCTRLLDEMTIVN